MILNDDIGVLGLDRLCQGTQQGGLTDTCHILQADFLSTSLNHLVGNIGIILNGVHGRCGDTKRSLRCHACSLSPFHRRDDVTNVVQAAENTGDINTLCMLYLILKFTNIIGYRIHAERVQTAVEHVSLNTHLIEWLTESTYGSVGVLASQQVHLLKGSTIGLHTIENAHVDDGRGNTL